jgi:drug/metabolite transporter (DMT)-like permease
MAPHIQGSEHRQRTKSDTRGPQRELEHRLSPRGIALAIAGACLFSTKPIIIKFTYAYPIDAVTLMTLRMGFSLPFYLLFAALALHERSLKGVANNFSYSTLAKTAMIGILGYYVASYLDLEGLTMVTAQFERLILFTYPTFVILLGALFFHQFIGPRIIVALGITYAGLAIIFGQDLQLFGNEVIPGSLHVLGAALAFAGFILFSQFEISKLGARLFTCFAMIAASLTILIHFALTHPLSMLVQPVQVYGLTFFIAVFATVIPSFLIAAAIEKIGSGPTALLSGIGPVFTTLLGITLLSEPFTFWHFTGMILVISGALILSQKRR